ncbi:MAG TPA: hypothetical protein VGO93_24820 [Candidatus Xenobia bacterium]|jgi:hypothetical protein
MNINSNDGPRARQFKAAIHEDDADTDLRGTPPQQRDTLQSEVAHANQMPVDSYQPSQGSSVDQQISNLRKACAWGWNR